MRGGGRPSGLGVGGRLGTDNEEDSEACRTGRDDISLVIEVFEGIGGSEDPTITT